jgi:hypothetical protein
LRPRSSWLRRGIRAFFILIALYIAAVWLDAWLTPLPPLAGTPSPRERVGVLHVHTNASCGSGSLPQVIDFAKRADLSFVAISDHNLALSRATVAAADPPEFAVIDGEEVSTSSGHYLALGITDAWPRGTSHDARALMASTRQAGAVNFIAHPYGLRERWRDWSIPDYDGMEIFNDDAIWRKNTVLDLATAFLMYPVNSRLALLRLARTPHENLTQWDALQQTRPVAGICGSDAHAAINMNGRTIARFPGYLPVFSLIREHVILPNTPGLDRDHASADSILAALKDGHSFCSVDAIYPADGFTQSVTSSTTKAAATASDSATTAGNVAAAGGTSIASTASATLATAGPGDSIAYAPGATLHVAAPAHAPATMIRVLRDGREIARRETNSLDLPLPGPGRYRAEAYLRQPGLTGWHRWTLWVVPNPVNVTAQ